jgi:Coenzyme PQQ synthesis protein D (PqqD)
VNDSSGLRRYMISPEISYREIEGQLLLLTPDDDALLTLNATGAAVWALLAEGADVNAMADRLARNYDITPERALADIEEFVSELVEKHIVVPA